MRDAAARIVEIGGQFDTQHLLEASGPSPNPKHVTAAGNALRERAAQFHAARAKESRKAPDMVHNGVMELAGSAEDTVQSSPSQGPGSGSMGGGTAPHGREMLRPPPGRSGAKRQIEQLEPQMVPDGQQAMDY